MATIKKIVLLALTALVMVGCSERQPDGTYISHNYRTYIIDSCEYVGLSECSQFDYLAHKGNCHFCKERDSIKWEKRKKELEELFLIKGEVTMETINEIGNLRYQIYSLTSNGELDKPITKPILTRERARKYFTDCVQCAIVSINECGSVVEILEKDTTPLTSINK